MVKARLLKKLSTRSHRRRQENEKKKQESSPPVCPEQALVVAAAAAAAGKEEQKQNKRIPIFKEANSPEQHDDKQDCVPRVVVTTRGDPQTPSPMRECAMTDYRERQQVERIAKAAAALDNYGNALFEQGEYDNAMASYSKALRLKKRTLKSLTEESSSSHSTNENEDEQRVLPSPKLQSSQSALMASVATSINNIGYLRQRSGRADAEETMAAYQDSLRIKTQILGKDSLSVAKTLNNIGSVHFLQNSHPKAMEAYREAHTIMSLNLGSHHLDVATVCSNMADVHLALGETDTARDKYREALSVRWEQLGEHDVKTVRLLEKIALIEMGELQQAQQLGVERRLQEEELLFTEDHHASIPTALDNLRTEVKQDLRHVDSVKRQLAIDLVKEKLQMRRNIRALDEGVEILMGECTQEQKRAAPLSPCDRTKALQSVKDRLERLRESRESPAKSASIKTAKNEPTKSAETHVAAVTPSPPRRNPDALRRLDVNTTTATANETVKEQLDRIRAASEQRRSQQQENSPVSSSRERAMERHVRATENVKETLERLRAKHKMQAACSKFERDGINALRRMNLGGTAKQEPVEM